MKTSVLSTSAWQQRLADLVLSLASDSFYDRLANACKALSGCEDTLVVWLGHDHRPITLYCNHTSEEALKSSSLWHDGGYLVDPYYTLFQSKAPDSFYLLDEVAPDNFKHTDFYQRYFEAMGHATDGGFLFKLSENHSMMVSIGKSDGQPFEADQIEALRAVCPVLSALCSRQQSAASGEVNFSAPLDKAFRNFGKDHLSARECEVIQLILKGHSNKSIARLLEISVDTVKVYNKRFHTKLEITSQAELFSLFLESIALVPFDADIDPLTHYLELRHK
jgi:DNA-binding CsgD family transcriptional regulator